MKRIAHLFLLIIISFSLTYWIGCGSSRRTMSDGETTSDQSSQEDFDEIEKLLGINRADQKSSTASKKQTEKTPPQSQKQDDLIKLLEVDEGKKADKPIAQTTAPVEDQRVTRLQNQVTQLESEMKKKNMEIADLRAQLMLKDEALQKQTSTKTMPVEKGFYQTPARSSGNISADDYSLRYEDAKVLFDQRQYQDAIKAFQQLLDSDRDHSLSDNAQYWIGECYYALGRYRESIMAFETVLSFPRSNKNDYAYFKLGQCYSKLGEPGQARQSFQQLIDNYPKSELVSRARNYLAQSQ